jgi:uncharacterized protein
MKFSSQLLIHKPLVEQYLKETPRGLSAFSFVNIFIWEDFFDFEFREIKNSLCVFASNPIGTFLYLPPLGKVMLPGTLKESFDLLLQRNQGSGVSRVENVLESQLNLFDSARYYVYKKAEEFIYSREAIGLLAGQRYKSKRSDVNQFARKHAYDFLPYQESMFEDCLDLYDRWAQGRKQVQRDPIALEMLKDNRLVHARALFFAKTIGLIGRVLVVDDKIVGYSFGYELTPSVFCILFEVTDLTFQGSACTIFKEFCLDPCVRSYDEINVMDDLGLEHLRQTKLSFRPSRMVSAYVVSLAEGASDVFG